MQHLYERVSYLRGLCEGMELSKESKEGKAIAAIIDTLDEFLKSFKGLTTTI